MTVQAIDDERRALLGLWGVPGVGPKTLRVLRAKVGDLGALADAKVASWARGLTLALPAREGLARVDRLADVADATLEAARRGAMEIAFQGDDAYPDRLVETHDAPPLLFYRGEVGAPRRRVAMVGSRKIKNDFFDWVVGFAQQVAERGLGVVSGAAEGVDRACHTGAVLAQQETWAFLGSALDEIDGSQARLMPRILETGGRYFSEFPPGIRADTFTFPRRNRLISGASDVTLIVRAGEGSGALYTARAAKRQGRKVLAMSGDVRYPDEVAGCHALLHGGDATLCRGVDDVVKAIGLDPIGLQQPGQSAERFDWNTLSKDARIAYDALGRTPLDFETMLVESKLKSGPLSSALSELELLGLVVQHPGKRYEKV